jgi:pimeloyl-ACP methyl ester carboxylesterase
MDHLFEAMVVEFPDDATVMGIIPLNVREENAEKHEQLLNTRVADARFILTQMGNLDIVKQLIPEATAPFDVNRAVMMGHSFGGATAVSALMQDARFIAAINMDGSIYGTLSKSSKPVLLFGRGAPDRRDRSNNATWQEVWKHLEQVYEINLKGAVRLAFSDLPLILKLGGAKNAVSSRMAGEMDGERCFEVVVGCVNEYLRMVFQGEGEYLEAWSKDEFPELELGVEGR